MALHTERGKKSEIQMRFIKSTRDLYTRCDAGRQKQFFFQGKYFIQSFPLMSQSTFETGDLFELKYYFKIFRTSCFNICSKKQHFRQTTLVQQFIKIIIIIILTSNPFFIISHSGHNYHFNTHRFLFWGNLLKAIKGDDYNNNHQRRGEKLIGRCCTLKRGKKKRPTKWTKSHTRSSNGRRKAMITS